MKFSMTKNPVYQVDFCAAASGKRLSATKRRVRFRFGFSNAESLAQGLSGSHCRGEEHDVSLVWSLTSGKRLVLADGEEVHFSQGRRTDTKFETSWTISGGHVLKIVAHATPPLFNTPGFRQFDLTVDGLSYFEMPKIFDLGVENSRCMIQSKETFAVAPAYSNYTLPRQEKTYWQHDGKSYALHRSVNPTADSWTSIEKHDAQPAPSVSRYEPMPTMVTHDQVGTGTPPSVMDESFFSSIPMTYDEFSPVEPVTQPPSAAMVHNQILSAYGAAPSTNSPRVLQLASESHTYQQPVDIPETPIYKPASIMYLNKSTPDGAEPPVPALVTPDTSTPPGVSATLTMMGPLQISQEEPGSELERALTSLVNIDDITVPLKTPEQLKREKEKENELKRRPTSRGLPPTPSSWHLGSTPSLKDIMENAEPRAAPSKEVMRTHAFDPHAAQAGMLVVYGHQPIASHGFGVTAATRVSAYNQTQYDPSSQQGLMYAAY